jgi:hypothetical protein
MEIKECICIIKFVLKIPAAINVVSAGLYINYNIKIEY